MKITGSLREFIKLKKVLALILSVLLLLPTFMFFVNAADKTKTALPLSAGKDALRNQFESGISDECNGYKLDYYYYSPAGENDTEKYPVVIYLHGIGHGSYVGSQLADSDMVTWASAELQSRWTDTGGAYILLPRCPENTLQYWDKTLVEPLRTLIDSFIRDNAKNIDTTRIFIGGSSAGGGMAWDTAIEYPEYFAGIYPLAATGTRSADDIKATKDIAIWVFASSLDPIISYSANVSPQWDKICEYNSNPANCRLSTFSTVLNPDGSKADSNHRLYTTISYDFFTVDGSVYPNVTTENGNGDTIRIEGTNGMISWMCDIRSDFGGDTSDKDASVNFLNYIFTPIKNFFYMIANFFQRLFGFV